MITRTPTSQHSARCSGASDAEGRVCDVRDGTIGVQGPRFQRATQAGGALTWIILAIVTFVIVAAVTIFIVIRSQANQSVRHRNALRISDEGLQQASLTLHSYPSWRAGFSRTKYLDGWYQVTVSVADTGGTERMLLVSEGHSGAASIRQACILLLTINSGDSIWAQQSLKQE